MTITVTSRLRSQLRVPVLRAGYALVLSSLATSALGGLFWFVAARRLSTESVGVGSALVAATTLLAGIANLGLKNGLLRFIPTAGSTTRRLIVRSYAVAGTCAIIAGTVFLAGLRIWTPDLLFLRENAGAIIVFLATLAAWSVFVLQDSVLIGLGQADWVPAENIAFAIVKIGLLVSLVAISPNWGVFLSWAIPTFALIAVVNTGIFRVLLPRVRSSVVKAAPFRAVIRFSLADQVATLLWIATLDGLPLLVLRRSGAEAAAYYYLAAQIAYGLYFVSGCIGAALVAEGARDRGALANLHRRSTRQAFGLVAPATAMVIAAAPWLQGVFGRDYRTNATVLLQLLALSALPYTFTSLTLSRARVMGQMRVVIGGHAALFVLCVGLAAVLQERHGLNGVGVGVLVGQSVVAAAFAGAAVLRRVGGRAASAGETSATDAAGGLDGLVNRLAGLRAATRGRRAEYLLPFRLAALQLPTSLHSGVARLVSVHNDVTIAEIRGERGASILKLATRRTAGAGLRNHVSALREISADRRFEGLAFAVPQVRAHVTDAARPFVIETRCDGVPTSDSFTSPARRDLGLASLGHSMSDFYGRSAHRVTVHGQSVASWVSLPLATMRSALRAPSASYLAGAAAIERELHSALVGREFDVTRVHGDLTPGNVMFDRRASTVSGLVDWERSHAGGIPAVDLMLFVLGLRRAREGRELGDLVIELCNGTRGLDAAEIAFLEQGGWSASGLSLRHLVLLAWLGHAESNLLKAKRYGSVGVWLSRNVVRVVEELGRSTAAREARGNRGRWAGLSAALRERSLVGVVQASLVLVAVGGLWWWSLDRIRVESMTDTGLVSVLPISAWIAIAGLIASIVVALTRPVLDERRLSVLLGGFIVLIHATPPVLYGTLRYSWAWKHVGIVDYITRRSSVNPRISSLDVYHNWPGFFSANAALVDLSGMKNAVPLAMLTPVVVNLLNLGALLLTLPALGASRRVSWTAAWFFFLANWVGQDYFSPQAMAYFLYLVLLALVLTRLPEGRWGMQHERVARGTRAIELPLLLAIGAAIISSHQVTPALLIVVIATLALSRLVRAGKLAVGLVVVQFAWLLSPARPFMSDNVASTLRSFGAPVQNVGATLRDTSAQSSGQAIVSLAGRCVVVLIALVAVVGLARRWRSGHRDVIAMILMIAPASLVVANEFGGEIVFRAFLFSVPFLSLFAAWALNDGSASNRPVLRFVGVASLSTALFFGFMLAHFGKDRSYHFTPSEVAAADYIADRAYSQTLLVEGNGNFPSQFRNYERFVHVRLTEEPRDSVLEMLDDPATRLGEWFEDTRFGAGYLVITRSQKADIEAEGTLPFKALDRIESALRSSPRFKVAFENPDAVIFELAAKKFSR